MKDSQRLFIQSSDKILTGEQAETALQQENDLSFVSEDSGIVHVPLSRWEKAQEVERQTWMEKGIEARNDRNDAHFRRFMGFQVLRGKRFDHAIELGCGPFTNLRFLAHVCQIRGCTLLDPLINDYLDHLHCRYTTSELSLDTMPWNKPRTFLQRVTNRLQRTWHNARPPRTIPIIQLINAPIETMPTSSTYDLIIIINVIEHCYDIYKIFENILAISRPGTILVFQDKYYDHTQVSKNTRVWYDAAHPLRVDRGVIDAFINTHFKPLYWGVEEERFELMDIHFRWDNFYIIAQRLPASS